MTTSGGQTGGTSWGGPPGGTHVGNFLGTAVLGSADHFIKKWGPSAAHAVIAKLSPASRALVVPNAPNMGILGARRYPYSFIGEWFRTMAMVARVPEDLFIREITAAGMDANLDTVGRIALRYAVSPQMIASRAQDLWNQFHDCGVVTVTVISGNEYVSEVTDWPHEVTVCKIAAEARRRLIERTGMKNVEVSRTHCVSWGHDRCTFRVRWS